MRLVFLYSDLNLFSMILTILQTFFPHTFRSFGNKLFYSFLGIPYAKPPIGIHRFNYTEPIEPWNGVFEADKHVACLQVSLVLDMNISVVTVGEFHSEVGEFQ